MMEGGLGATIRKTQADLTRLAKAQAELAKQRFQQMARKKAMFAGMAAGGGIFLLYAPFFLLGAAAAGLAILFPVWLSLLIVGGGVVVLGGLLVAIGGKGLKGSPKGESDRSSNGGPEPGVGTEEPWLPAKNS
jgi:hypothetical protein